MAREIQRNRTQKCIVLAAALCVLAALLAAVIWVLCSRTKPFSPYNTVKDDGLMEADMQRISSEMYDSVFLSMHGTGGFLEEDFKTYCGVNTLVADHAIMDVQELSAYLEAIVHSDNEITGMYLCLDPERLWLEAGRKADKWNELLQDNLYRYVTEHPDISFEVLLPFPYQDYWLSLEEQELEELLTVYNTYVAQLYAMGNVKLFFPGYEPWVMSNAGNYTQSLFEVNEVVGRKLFLYTFCDGEYQITPVNAEFFWDSLRNAVSAQRETPVSYPDLSKWDIVFFGDSVVGNYRGSISLPGCVTGLSKAVTYNLAVGGSSAAYMGSGAGDFSHALDAFFAGEQEFSGEELCFVINYGFNDYFSGLPIDNPEDAYDITAFKGGLRTGIKRLREIYPKAHYIIMTPTQTSFFENGTMLLSDRGGVLEDYVAASREIAAELDAKLLDNYADSGITQDNLDKYLIDGVHPSENGHLLLAQRLIRFIEESANTAESSAP